MTYQPGALKSILPEHRSKKRATMEAILDPQVGDAFHEMFSYWLIVVRYDMNDVWYLDGNPPISFPEEGRLVRTTLSKYIEYCTYDSPMNNQSWLRLHQRGVDVTGGDTCEHREEVDQ